MSYTITETGGLCPMYAEGAVEGGTFRFRARGTGWTFIVSGFDLEPVFYVEDVTYAPWPEAGYMSEKEARRIIGLCVEAYLKRLPRGVT